MGKYTGYLIASDLDGTLLNSEHSLPQQNIDAIAAFVEEGGLFAIATGRTELTALSVIENTKVNCPCILYNGVVIYDLKRKTRVMTTILDKTQLLVPLKELLLKYKNLCMQIFVPGKIYIVSDEGNIDPIMLKEEHSFELACLDDIADEDWIKVLMVDTNHTLQKIQQYLHKTLPDGMFHTVFSGYTYFELFAKGVSKGNALESLIEMTGVKRERVIAIGDYCNDIEMVEAAGMGIATANAHPLLKEKANIISVSNDEHAIKQVIDKILPIYASLQDTNEAPRFLRDQDLYMKIPV